MTDKEESFQYRFGLRHAFSPNSIFLASIAYKDVSFTETNPQPLSPPLSFISFDRPERSIGPEFQHLFRSQYVNVTSGAGYVKIDGNIDIRTELSFLPGVFFPAKVPLDTKHTNVYSYANINVLKNVTFTLGASGDFQTSDSPELTDKNQFNPKVGMTWNPFPDTTLRAAAFRVLKRTLISNQTLEPTQVAGFNQFFDDPNGTQAWRYGGAIDQKFTKEIFGGVEYSKRDLKVPFLDASNFPLITPSELAWHEYLARVYLFWTPHPWWAVRAEYQYEQDKRDERFTAGLAKMDTYRVPIGANFFHPSGLGAFVKGTYVHQSGTFSDFITGGAPFRSGSDSFYLVDAGISYRLPKRYGFFTVGVTNLLDKKFKFFNTDVNNPNIQPARTVFARLTLSLP